MFVAVDAFEGGFAGDFCERWSRASAGRVALEHPVDAADGPHVREVQRRRCGPVRAEAPEQLRVRRERRGHRDLAGTRGGSRNGAGRAFAASSTVQY